MKTIVHGPTLNLTYNALLVRWAEQGSPSPPECEECGEDLTGKKVHDTGTCWVCASCNEKKDDEPSVADNVGWREDFHSDV